MCDETPCGAATLRDDGAATDHAVLIAGGGPTGLMLAAELALAGVDVAVVERRATQALDGSRAGGLHPRTLELLDQRGIAERFVARGQRHARAPFAAEAIDIGDLPTRHNYWLALWQNEIERILAERVAELGVPVHRGREVAGLADDGARVAVALADGGSLRARYLVGCDGGRSVVRRAAGIEFPGWEATKSYLIVEAETREEPAWGLRRDAHGLYAIARHDDGRRVRAVLSEPGCVEGAAPTLDDVRAALRAAYGTDYGIHAATWVSRFTDAARQAATYRRGRVLLAGDAAHVHSPVGGQGLNLGVQDAVNLGWKLARVVRGASPEALLDSYHAERHPAGARVLRLTMALTALERGDARTEALREMVGAWARIDDVRQRYFAELSGLDVRYELGAGHPLLGRRVPDLDLVTSEGPRRLYALLHRARPVLLDLGALGGVELGPWAAEVDRVEARCEGAWELPALGEVTPPGAVLIRPDGHAAWVGDGPDAGLDAATRTWFGPGAEG